VHIVNPPGHEENPLSPADLAAKFTRLVEPRLGKERAAAALKHWQNIASAKSVNNAFDAVNVAESR